MELNTYVALRDASKEALLMRAVLFFLQPQLAGMYIDIFGDNQGAMSIANNPSRASRSKRIDMKFHFIQGCAFGWDSDSTLRNESQHAGILTKALWCKAFVMHRTALMDLAGLGKYISQNCDRKILAIFLVGYLE